jgi:hypothetical protein
MRFAIPHLRTCCAGLFLSAFLLLPNIMHSAELLEKMLNGPLADVEEIVFANRQSGVDHWYGNFGYYAANADNKVYWAQGRLCKLNLRTNQLTILLNDREGAIRDPQVHYDGKTILFSWRKGGSDYFHLYEIQSNGTGLRQITDGPWDDMEPTYLPDGDIMFISSRCKRWVQCWLTQVAVMHRCGPDGSNIRQISANVEHDNTPWPLPDGRVLYTRWEYVDRSQVNYHHLWAANPDGTRQWIYYGNMRPGILMIDAKPVPNSNKVVAVFSPGHGRPEHTGAITLVSPDTGPDDESSARMLNHKNSSYRDPYPLSEDCFLVAQMGRLLVMDGAGETQDIFSLPPDLLQQGMECHEPRPLMPRARERVIPERIDQHQETGQLALMDVYNGRNMEGVQRGDITELLVLESLPKPINFTGGMEPLSYGGTFTLERILGTVPVEEDGSAFMELPADRSVFFVALDAKQQPVKRMQSFVSVRPGETTSCIGCHEQRTLTPGRQNATALALQRAPSHIQPIPDVPEVMDFPRDIQPILDKHCASCHGVEQRAGNVLLTGDRGPLYSHSYFMLTTHQQIADGRNKAESNYAPYAIGSAASPLMHKIDQGHHGVKLSNHERTLVRLWIEAGAAYPGTYAALGSGMIGGYARNHLDRSDLQWQPVRASIGTMKRRCGTCHTENMTLPETASDNMGMPPWQIKYSDPRLQFSRHILYNLTTPEQSLLLMAPLAKKAGGYGICRDVTQSNPQPVIEHTSDANYLAILSAIRFTAKRLDEMKRFDMPGFRPRQAYIREMQRFGILPPNLAADTPVDAYATDRAYWKSLWYRPAAQLQD